MMQKAGDHDQTKALAQTTRARRFVMYTLISGQHLVNLLVRFAVPFVVVHLVRYVVQLQIPTIRAQWSEVVGIAVSWGSQRRSGPSC